MKASTRCLRCLKRVGYTGVRSWLKALHTGDAHSRHAACCPFSVCWNTNIFCKLNSDVGAFLLPTRRAVCTHLLLAVLLPRLVSSLAQPARMLLPVLATVWAFHLNHSIIPSFHQMSYSTGRHARGVWPRSGPSTCIIPSFHHSLIPLLLFLPSDHCRCVPTKSN